MIRHRALPATGPVRWRCVRPALTPVSSRRLQKRRAARVEACIVNAVERYADGSECVGVIFNACEGHDETTDTKSR